VNHHTDPNSVATVRKVAAEVLHYPEMSLLDRLPVLSAAVARLTGRSQEALAGLLDHLGRTPLHELQQDYVATFDLKRRCCLYLSYYLNGDTRRRGMALVAFKDVYRRAGMAFESDELPDFLPVVLEFAAVGDAQSGEDLLIVHRQGLEVLALALSDRGSPYHAAVVAVLDTLPPAGPHDREAAQLLAVQGPPAELVGLEPFGPPETTGVGMRS
jgi:nitrate reductase delta subunit